MELEKDLRDPNEHLIEVLNEHFPQGTVSRFYLDVLRNQGIDVNTYLFDYMIFGIGWYENSVPKSDIQAREVSESYQQSLDAFSKEFEARGIRIIPFTSLNGQFDCHWFSGMSMLYGEKNTLQAVQDMFAGKIKRYPDRAWWQGKSAQERKSHNLSQWLSPDDLSRDPETVKLGDLVVYSNGRIRHSAVVSSISGGTIRCTSKLGNGPVAVHEFDNPLVTSFYGELIGFINSEDFVTKL